MPVYFAAPTFLRQGVVAGFVLSGPDWAGTPPGTGATVSFPFYVTDIVVSGVTIHIATGYQHWVNIGGDVYSYVQQNSDTPTIVATALRNAINAAPEGACTATSSGGVLTLTPRDNTGAAIACTASDGATTALTLFELTGNELIPAVSRGVLFAQGTLYRPAVPPTLPAAPASQQSWLYYNSGTGWYWGNTPMPTTFDDACVGWVVCNATSVIAFSSRKIGAGDEAVVLPGGPVAIGVGSSGYDAGVPPVVTFQAAETDTQLVLGNLAFASGLNTDGVDFASFILYYVDETVAPTLTLTAPMTSGATSMTASGPLPASVPGSVTFTFVVSGTYGGISVGPGYRHSISIGAATYVYDQQVEDTAAIVATELADVINAAPDANALATAVGATVVLTALQNTAGTVTCSASDGNVPATLTETMPSWVVIDQEIIQVDASNGSVVLRGQKASAAAAHLAGALVWPVAAMSQVFALPQFAYGTPAWPTVIGQIPFAGKALVAADCWVSNEIGPSPITTDCFTGFGPYALDSSGNPLAPDVAGFTAVVTTNISVAGQPYYQFSGTVTTGLAPANTAEIDVVMTDGGGVTAVAARFLAPFAASTVLNWKGPLVAQATSGASLTFTPTVVPLNVDGAPTVSLHTVAALTVAPLSVASVAATLGANTVDEVTRQVHCHPIVAPVLTGGQVPQWLTFYVSQDNGATTASQGNTLN